MYPVFLKIHGHKCLVIGGGGVAERKIDDLLSEGAEVTVIASQATNRIDELAKAGKINLKRRDFADDDVEKSFSLVFSTTDDPQINRQVSSRAAEVGIPVNIADQPELCDFFIPSVVRRGDLNIAVSTGGKSPALAKSVRERLEEEFGPEYEEWVNILGEFRRRISLKLEDIQARKSAYERLLDSNVLDDIRAHRRVDVDSLVARFAR